MRTIPIHNTLNNVTPGAQIWTGRCAVKSCIHGGDGVNDYELAVFDCVGVPAGTEVQVYPICPYAADAYGLNGSERDGEADCIVGAYVIAYDIGGGAYSGGDINVTTDIIVG